MQCLQFLGGSDPHQDGMQTPFQVSSFFLLPDLFLDSLAKIYLAIFLEYIPKPPTEMAFVTKTLNM